MKSICFVATTSAALNSFLREIVIECTKTYSVHLVVGSLQPDTIQSLHIPYTVIDISRKPSIFKDLIALLRLFFFFRKNRFQLVQTIMPKTGLLGMAAAWMARVQVRVHTFTGQPWAMRTGLSKAFYKSLDRMIVFLATQILVDSPSQHSTLLHEKVVRPNQALVINNGSICGVNPSRFKPDSEVRVKVRKQLELKPESFFILYVGRLTRDKGVLDLASAFCMLAVKLPHLALVFVGQEEDVTFCDIKKVCHEHLAKIHFVPFTSCPESYMAGADILCLPSYREGFGQVLIEAAACGIPAVASDIYGICDAVEDGVTGILFSPGSISELSEKIKLLAINTELCTEMGKNALTRALSRFSSQDITNSTCTLYQQLTDYYFLKEV